MIELPLCKKSDSLLGSFDGISWITLSSLIERPGTRCDGLGLIIKQHIII